MDPHSKIQKIQKLSPTDQSEYVPFLLGNDTPLINSQLDKYKLDKDFVLIGTGLFRSIDIACHLASNTNEVMPTIVIVDNSRNTSLAWEKIKTFFANSSPESSVRDFLYKQDGFLELINELMAENIIQSDGDILPFFLKFLGYYSLSYVQQIISKLVVIEQDWANKETFSQLSEIYRDQPVVTYSSNIIDFVSNTSAQAQIVNNIEQLKPYLSLCTNYDKLKKKPTKSHVIEGGDPIKLCELLNLPETIQQIMSCKKTDTVPSDAQDTQDPQEREDYTIPTPRMSR